MEIYTKWEREPRARCAKLKTAWPIMPSKRTGGADFEKSRHSRTVNQKTDLITDNCILIFPEKCLQIKMILRHCVIAADKYDTIHKTVYLKKSLKSLDSNIEFDLIHFTILVFK